MALLVVSASLLSACGASTEPRATTPAPTAPQAVVEASTPEPITIDNDHRIDRAELIPILDEGFGRFLAHVETEPAREHGEFVGFRLVHFFDGDPRFASVDLHVGDTIMRVNGRRIQRPEDAMAVWNELRVASELLVEYVREGERKEIRFAIIN